MIDSQGKFLGRFNIIDLSFVIIVIAMAAGLGWMYLGKSPLEQKILAKGEANVLVGIRGARFRDPGIFKKGEDVFLTIRNQRYEPVHVVDFIITPRQSLFLDHNDKPVLITDPSQQDVKDIDLTFTHSAEETAEGIVMGGHQIKVGATVELDAYGYHFNASILKVNFKGQ